MTTAMRACLACQTPLPEEAHFCFQCGAVTPTEEGVPPRAAATSTRQIERVRQALASRGYTIERVLGEGGMATVYLATDGKHRRQVAVKVMRPELAATVGAERFLREVEIAAQLTHPHILPVHDSGEVDGVLYYVMPYVEGESLHDRIKRETQLPVEEALRIAREVSEALAYAHGKRIVHRDIKPGNIMLSAGHALVADFGIARAVDARGGSITGTGLAVGTPQYMSPEQASGSSNIDIRTDIYALGAVLYEMLTGETPFTGPNAQAIIIRLLTETPRALSTSRAGIPAEVEALVQRSLVKNPADRWQSTAEFANALRGAEDQLRLGPISGVRTPAPMPTVATGRSARKLWFSFGVGGLVVVALLYGLVFRGSAGASTKGSGIRLAVLPFENRGAADDSYFVDGVADQVRGKLMNVAGFQIIARTSSDQYRGSKKTPQEIGRELGVDFLLTSTVTWDKSAGGKGRIRVIPELIDVKTGAGTWQQSFDAELTDIFQVQGSIASQVAGALNVALAPVDQERLDARPTRSLEAYDWFLKARAVTSSSPADLRKTIGYYQQAVALDSTFAEAWGQLAYSLSRLYYNSTPLPEIAAEARSAVDRVTRLAPRTAVSLEASSRYKQLVANDVTGAIEDGMAALRLAPNNASMLRLAARLETILGRWPEGLAHAEAAARLDPRGIPTKSSLVRVLIPMRKYPEAIRVLEEIQAESPSLSDLEYLVLANLMQGDLSSARRLIATTPPWTSREELVGYLGLYYDLFWILEAPDQKVLLGLGPERFDGDRAGWSLTMMQLHYHRGERALARAWADTARVELQRQLARVPDDPQRNLYLGYTHAVLGHKAEAIAAAERGDSLTSVEKDQDTGAYMRHQLIRIYLVLGENEKALDLLEHLVKIPYFLTPQWLSIDPNFAPLRGNPRFEKLLKGPQTLTF